MSLQAAKVNNLGGVPPQERRSFQTLAIFVVFYCNYLDPYLFWVYWVSY